MFEMLNINSQGAVTLSLAIILFAAFLMTRITKKFKLPNVTGYILAGVIIGPCLLKLIPQNVISGMDFVTDTALAFIAFGVGKYLKADLLKRNSKRVFIITACESLIAALVVTLTMLFVFRLPLEFSLMLGAIGSATAPASTIMTIRQYHAKGVFVDTLLQVVALDDVVALIAFSAAAAVTQAMTSASGVTASVVLTPILVNVGVIAGGALLGYLLNKMLSEKRTKDHRLILTVAVILLATGVCSALNVSPLLACMAIGAVYSNVTDDDEIFHQINKFTPPVLTTFFVLSGMRLDLGALSTAGAIGITYFAVRIVGKYAGAYLGGAITHAPHEVRNYLGMALCPQAGVSIGLAVLAERILPGETGALISVIILSSSVLYEMIGPACAKAALFLSGSIKKQ